LAAAIAGIDSAGMRFAPTMRGVSAAVRLKAYVKYAWLLKPTTKQHLQEQPSNICKKSAAMPPFGNAIKFASEPSFDSRLRSKNR
jgi:hypothetical protein